MSSRLRRDRTSPRSSWARAGIMLALVILPPASGNAQETRLFEAIDGAYSFRYPLGFGISTEFADGSGDRDGVTASTPRNGDVGIRFYANPAGAIDEISEQTRQAVIHSYVKQVAVRPSIKLKSAAMTRMLGRPAVDMIFENRRFGRTAINRYVATVRNGQAYNFICFYREDKAAEFAPACDLAVATVMLRAGARKGAGQR